VLDPGLADEMFAAGLAALDQPMALLREIDRVAAGVAD
jgi:hypothetical protein